MLNKFITAWVFLFLFSCTSNYKNIPIKNTKQFLHFDTKIVFQNVEKTYNKEENIINSQLVYKFALEVLIFFVFIAVLLLIIVIPVLLLYTLLTSLILLEKQDKSIFYNWYNNEQIKKQYQNYKTRYSNFISSSLGFLTWVVLSLIYIFKNFKSASQGLKNYFSFPFKFIGNLTLDSQKILTVIPMKNWLSMLFIVITSIIILFIGKYVTFLIFNRNFKESI